MDDRVDIRPRPEDGCMDYPLLIRLGLRAREDVSFQIEFEDIPLCHHLRRKSASNEKRAVVLRIPDAYVTEGIEDGLVCEDPVCPYELLDGLLFGFGTGIESALTDPND